MSSKLIRAKAALFRECDRCAYCGKQLTLKTATVDHVIARCWGAAPPGQRNLWLACKVCNRFKDVDPVESFVSPRCSGERLFYVWEFQPLERRIVMVDQQIVGFNYDALAEGARAQAKEHAGKIRNLLQRSSSAIVEIGRRLAEVHAALGRKQYQAWLKAEFRWSQSVASNFESVARKLGDLKSLDQFQPSALYLLSRDTIDPRVMKEATRRAAKGEIITRAVVVNSMRKFLPAPAERTADSVPAPLKSDVNELRRFIRRVDVTLIPHDQRAQLADELQELALQLRSGRTTDGAPIEPKPQPAVAPPARPKASPATAPVPTAKPRPASKRRQPAEDPETRKCA